LLVCLLTFDSLFSSHAVLKEHWSLYWRSVKSILHNPSKYRMTREQIRSLDKHLASIENALLTGNIFKTALEKCLDEKLIFVIKNSSLSNEIAAYINQLLNELERDEENIFFTQVWLQVNSLVVLEHYLFGSTDKKLVKRLLEVNKKVSYFDLLKCAYNFFSTGFRVYIVWKCAMVPRTIFIKTCSLLDQIH
jgi:hypothetical protein